MGLVTLDTPKNRRLRFWWAAWGGDTCFTVYRSPSTEIALKALWGYDLTYKMEKVLMYDPDDEDLNDLAYWTPHTGWRRVPYNWMDTFPQKEIRLLDEEGLNLLIKEENSF